MLTEIKFPHHEASLHLTHNEHKSCYQTVEQHINQNMQHDDCMQWISEDEKQKAIDTNEMWVLHWYPRTPIGFCYYAASNLEKLLEFCNQVKG